MSIFCNGEGILLMTRFMCRVLGVILQTGVDHEKASGMLDELDTLSQTKVSPVDDGTVIVQADKSGM